MIRRVLVAILAMALLAVALTSPAATAARAKAPAPTIGPATAIAGEPITVRGTLPTRGQRTVVLQRKDGRRWVTIARTRSTRTGAVAVRTPARAMTVRLQAPRSKGRKAWTSKPRTFRPSRAVPSLVQDVYDMDISASGRFVAFSSAAGDPGGFLNVFVRDRASGTTEQVTYVAAPGDADGDSYEPSISADGSTVAFRSDATNLVADDTNGVSDVYTWDRGGSFSRMSVDDAGNESPDGGTDPSLSDDGRTVAFTSTGYFDLVDGNGQPDVYVRFRDDNKTNLYSGNITGGSASGASTAPAISGDGRWVVYSTSSTDVVADDTNGRRDIVRVSLYAPGRQLVTRGGNADSTVPSVSYDGQRVAFLTGASNLALGATAGVTHVLSWDARTNRRTLASRPTGATGRADSGSNLPEISGNGRFVAFISFARNLAPGDTHGRLQAYVRNLDDRVTSAVSVTRAQRFGTADIYALAIDRSGRYAALATNAILDPADPDAGRSLYVVDRRSRP